MRWGSGAGTGTSVTVMSDESLTVVPFIPRHVPSSELLLQRGDQSARGGGALPKDRFLGA